MSNTRDHLIVALSRLVKSAEDRAHLTNIIKALDGRYDLSAKVAHEPGVEQIITQLIGRLLSAFGSTAAVKGKRILDIACGSNTSEAPSFVFVDTPFGEQRVGIPHVEGHTAQFEPWLCRILLELESHPVGVDLGDLEGEAFEHYKVDLGQPGALDFLPSHSFDAVQDSRLFGSPEFTAQFPNRADRLRIADEIVRQERRLLRRDGVVIHSDAAALV
jgi:hypothetical protein